MIEITVRQGVKTLTVTSKTPRVGVPYENTSLWLFTNRRQRRAAVHSSPVARLQEKVKTLRKDMIAAGIYPPPVPSSGEGMSRRRKVLSGYHGRLCELARKGVA